MALSSELIRHCKDKKETFINQYQGNKFLHTVYKRVIEEKLETSYETCEKITIHESPNELALLADQAGYRRALKEILNLLP